MNQDKYHNAGDSEAGYRFEGFGDVYREIRTTIANTYYESVEAVDASSENSIQDEGNYQ